MFDAEMTIVASADTARTGGVEPAAGRFPSVSRWLAAGTGALALLVLAGWLWDLPSLRSVVPDAVQMKANTAVSLLLAALSLYFRGDRSSPRQRRISGWSAGLVASIGAVTLGEYVFGWRLGIDELLFTDHYAAFNAIRGRMSPYSAVAFIAIGGSLAAVPRPRLRWLAILGAIAAAAIGAVSIVGYTWNASELTTDQVLPPVAVNTALAFLLLSVGLFAQLADTDAAERGGVETKVLFAFVAALLLLYLAGGITYRMGVSFTKSAQWVAHTEQARAALGDLHAAVADAESAQRNHLLTGSPGFQTEYERVSLQADADMQSLGLLFAADPAQQARLGDLRSAVGARMQALAQQAALAPPPGGDQIRNTIRIMDDAEAELLTARVAELTRNRSLTLYALMATLAVATAALLLLFRSITGDIRERARIAVALTEAQHEAQRANRAKSEFLAAMSHEIRTPMNGVIGMVDVLLHSSLSAPQVEMAGLIRESADSLLTIIDDILDFSKIEAGRLEFEPMPFSVLDVVEKTCSFLNPLAARKEVSLTVFADPALPLAALGDGARLRQVLINLVGNAVKFCSGLPRPGQISVRTLLAENHPDRVLVEFQVRDNGIGMSEETLRKVFASFTQADASTTRKYGGTGLGLAISRQLAQLMGGEISVSSSPDKGSTFSLRLPFALAPSAAIPGGENGLEGRSCLVVGKLHGVADDIAAYLASDGLSVIRAPHPPAAHEAARAHASHLTVWVVEAGEELPPSSALEAAVCALPDPAMRVIMVLGGRGRIERPERDGLVIVDGNALNRRTLLNAISAATGRPAGQTDELARRATIAAPPLGTLILVAEDNEINQLVIRHQLQLLGYGADVVGDGREALRRWKGGNYALLVTDLHMPEMDGYDLTLAIRLAEGGRSRIPIVALTANALNEDLERCRGAGMDDYLSKPVALTDLGAMLARWLPAHLSAPHGVAHLPANTAPALSATATPLSSAVPLS
jgi:signal transduction histidine kinase/CheY-like chemotaxis protein